MSIDGHLCKIIACHSHMAVSVARGDQANAVEVIQWPWQEGNEQVFRITAIGDDRWRLTPQHSGKAIGKAGDVLFIKRNDIIQWDWNPQDGNLQFHLVPLGGDEYRIGWAGDNRVMAVQHASELPGARLILWDWLGSAEQRFRIVPVDEPLQIPWSVNLHPEDVGLDHNTDAAPDAKTYPQQINQAMRLIHELGAQRVRMDYSWRRLADTGHPDAVRAFYDCVTTTARDYGLGIDAILFRAPAHFENPAGREPDQEWAGFLDAFSGYTREVAARWGQGILTYQIWNEANTWLPGRNALKNYARGDAATLFLRADAALTDAIGRHQAMINLMCNNDPIWANTLRIWLDQMDERAPNHQVRLIGIDHYPGTWTLSGFEDWEPVQAVIAALAGRAYDWAVAETGYASGVWKGVPLGHTPESQRQWIDQSLGALYKRLRYNEGFRSGLRFINLYQLYDVDPAHAVGALEALAPFEPFFGLCQTDGTPKPAYHALQQRIAEVR